MQIVLELKHLKINRHIRQKLSRGANEMAKDMELSREDTKNENIENLSQRMATRSQTIIKAKGDHI